VKQVFADTLYWVAIFLPVEDLSGASLVTTEQVLREFLTAVSARPNEPGVWLAGLSVSLTDPAIEVVAQSHESFFARLELNERRPGKFTARRTASP
jgi:CRISPR/Cas system endoribonuclease Cas6 (RAMP superfamily)